MKKSFGFQLAIFVLGIFTLVGTTHYMGLSQDAIDQRNWETIKVTNSCKYVNTVPGTQGRLNGRVVYTDDKEVYRCAGGEMKERPVRD